ncbi:MAG TPA: adenylate kinase [Thermoanaerobaculia bacterium]|nr:adenylate kinase [Thermoanaerobaculia bacterium]
MKVILVGAPGSGKGTQAKRFADGLHIPHISTGDILREAVRNGTELGKQADPIMASGALVPDDLMVGIVAERLGQDDAKEGFILDGFPRTVAQAEMLDGFLGRGNGAGGVNVVHLLVPDELIVNRIAARRSCGACGASYHLENSPPKQDSLCDRCGGVLETRPDDVESAVRKRLETFHRQTVPVIDYYRAKNVLHEVDGNAPVDEVFERVKKSLRA